MPELVRSGYFRDVAREMTAKAGGGQARGFTQSAAIEQLLELAVDAYQVLLDTVEALIETVEALLDPIEALFQLVQTLVLLGELAGDAAAHIAHVTNQNGELLVHQSEAGCHFVLRADDCLKPQVHRVGQVRNKILGVDHAFLKLTEAEVGYVTHDTCPARCKI